MQLIFDDVCYYIQEYLNITANHVLYVPTNTPNDPTELAKAAQKRIDEYIGENIVTIEANTANPTVSKYLDNRKTDFNKDLSYHENELPKLKEKYASLENELNDLEPDDPKCYELTTELSNLQFKIWEFEFEVEDIKNSLVNFERDNAFLYELLNNSNSTIYTFKATVNNKTYDLIILPDSSKMLTPTFGTKDV